MPLPISTVPAVSALLHLSGRVALVTGASGTIGAGIARRFAEAGAHVIAHYGRHRAAAEATVDTIVAAGGRAVALGADLTRQPDVEHMLDACQSAAGLPTILVNNAGTYPVAPLLEMTEPDWDAVVAANLKSVHLVTQALSRRVVAAGVPAAIVNIASIEASNVAPLHAHYAAAKAGVVMHTRVAARELGAHGIRVNAVSPGLIWFDGLDAAWPDGVGRYTRAVPLGRLGLPADVADACLFLASDAARWITGSELVVDGGVLTNTAY
jgi:NAD(P)-dependent dehydrogenase (short-subunit alcohol dehydrogenase family)